MGMPISIDIPKYDEEKIFNAAFDRLRQLDERFSPYKENSELVKYQRGELNEKNLSAEFKKIMQDCKKANRMTDGYFSAYFAGKFDPTGYVKGWAINEAGKIIEKAGFKTYCIGAGGDVMARSDGEKAWSIGIQDPFNKDKILNKLSINNGAVATSGNYERGKHIINPKTGEIADDVLSVSVAGPDIIKADVLATAIFAEGLPGLVIAEKTESYEALLVDKNGDWYVTSNMESLMDLD
jgi:thiamine biosynthesis lipoprotein